VTRSSVVIIGGGLSGLAAAWELTGAEKGPDNNTPRVELIEANDYLGGALATTEFAGRTVDLGADGFLARRPEATTLVNELGWQDRLEAIAVSGSNIWLQGALYALPQGLVLGVPTSSAMVRSVGGLTWRAREHARRDEVLPKRMNVGDDISIGEILRTKLGAELAYTFIEPMIGGIQAGRIDELSAKTVFPQLYEAAKKGGSLMKSLKRSANAASNSTESTSGPVFYSLTSGVGSLPVELGRRLRERGVVMRLGVGATALRRSPSGSYPWEVDTSTTTTPANAIILATPAAVTGHLLGNYHHDLDALRHVRSAGAAMITFSIPRGEVALPEHGTGVLVPLGTSWSSEGSMMVTAITLLDRKWPHLRRDDDVLLRAHVGRSDDDRWTTLDNEALSSRIAQELAVLLPRFAEPTRSLVQRWSPGLPQYLVGHDKLVHAARAAASPMGVALAGLSYDGVGVPASIGSGRNAAKEILTAQHA
jgi:protoporphyrinogen/coproporphyrinogen III oxidase